MRKIKILIKFFKGQSITVHPTNIQNELKEVMKY